MQADIPYPVIVRALAEQDGGGFLAEAPDLPGCQSDGETPEAALRNIRDAIAAWITTAKRLRRSIPPPDAHVYSSDSGGGDRGQV